jgi:type I restriction enzyme, S subunit
MFGSVILNEKKWPAKGLLGIAPNVPYTRKIMISEGRAWLLNLDAVESNTGRLIKKWFSKRMWAPQ